MARANWTFLLWGFVYYVALIFEKLTSINGRYDVLTRVWTLLVVLLAWVLFRSADVVSAGAYVATMLGMGASGFYGQDFLYTLQGTYVVLIAALVGVTPLMASLFGRLRASGREWAEDLWLLIVFVLSLLQVVGSTYNPFIYFNF